MNIGDAPKFGTIANTVQCTTKANKKENQPYYLDVKTVEYRHYFRCAVYGTVLKRFRSNCVLADKNALHNIGFAGIASVSDGSSILRYFNIAF